MEVGMDRLRVKQHGATTGGKTTQDVMATGAAIAAMLEGGS
jgi:hypothetical protein